MAKLIVVRPAASRLFPVPACHVLVDGQRAATLAAGMRAEIPLQPGHHAVSARMRFLRSPIVPVECEPETMLCLRVSFTPFLDLPGWLTFVLCAVGPVGGFLVVGVHRALVADSLEHAQFIQFIGPFTFLGYAAAGVVLAVTQQGSPRLETIPAVDPAS